MTVSSVPGSGPPVPVPGVSAPAPGLDPPVRPVRETRGVGPPPAGGTALAVPTDRLSRLARGFGVIAELAARTLGPGGGHVVHGGRTAGQAELLDDASVIAQRVHALPGRAESAGAMLARQMLLAMTGRHGDGAATTAVLAAALLRAGERVIAAGHDPVRVRAGMDDACRAVTLDLAGRARPVEDEGELVALAEAVTDDPALAALLGEITSLAGEHAAVFFERTPSPGLDREYVGGGRWLARPAHRFVIPAGRTELSLDRPAVLVVDQALQREEDIIPALQAAVGLEGNPPLVLVASEEISDPALSVLTRVHAQAQAVVAPMVLAQPAGGVLNSHLADIALLAGAAIHADQLGRPLRRVNPSAFGRARHVSCTSQTLTVRGCPETTSAIGKRLEELSRRASELDRASPEWEELIARKARLSGGVVVLSVGASDEEKQEALIERAKRGQRALAAALAHGVVPGGGASYLGAGDALERLGQECAGESADWRAGLWAVGQALSAPLLRLTRNDGRVDPALALAEVRRLGPGAGYDARTGQVCPPGRFAVIDPLEVVTGALEAAVSATGTLISAAAVIPAR